MPGFTVAHLRADSDRMPRRHTRPRYPHPPPPPPPGAAAAAVSWAGRIRFLPPKREITVDCSSIALDEEGYDHPVVILSSSISPDGKVEVLTVTSFQKQDLQDHFREPHKRHLWADYLPIHPSKPHPTDGLILELAPGCEPLRKNSYVNISRRLTIPLDATRRYTRGHDSTALSPASFKILAQRCGYPITTGAVGVPAPPLSPPLSPTEEDMLAVIYRASGFPPPTPRRTSEPSSSSLPRTRPPAVAAMTEPPAYSYLSRISGQRQPQRTPRPSASASSHHHHDQRYCPSSLPDAYPSDSRNARSNERTSLRGSSNNAARLNYGAMSRPVWPPSPAPPRGPSVWARLGHCLLRAVEGTAMWFWWRKEYILAWAALMLVFFGTGWCVVKGCQLVKAGWDWVAAGVSGAAEGVVRWIKDVLGVRI